MCWDFVMFSRRLRQRYWHESTFKGVEMVHSALDEVYGTGKVSLVSAAFRWLQHHSQMKPECNGEGDSLSAIHVDWQWEIVSQARPTFAKGGKGLVDCVCKPCSAAVYSAVQSHCSILSHDTLCHCLSSNSGLENGERKLGHLFRYCRNWLYFLYIYLLRNR